MRRLKTNLLLMGISSLFLGILNCSASAPEPQISLLDSNRVEEPNLVETIKVPTFVGQPIRLPEDDSEHVGVTTEWWYYNGHLVTENGKAFDFHYVVFALVQPDLSPVAIAHLGIGDVQEEVYVQGQRIDLLSAARREGKGFAFNLQDWTMSGFDGNDKLKASVEDYEFDLNVKPLRPPILHSKDGVLDFERAGTSYYYSRTRQEISGNILVRNVDYSVSGIGWFDHQWGDFTPVQIGWDWFSLQLSDETDLMITALRDDANESISRYGTFVQSNGISFDLTENEIEIEPLDCWVSESSGISYPIQWKIKVPRYGIDLVLESRIPESEFDSIATTGNHYWEGAVEISGTHSGDGFVELAGYPYPDSSLLETSKAPCGI